LIYYHTKDTDKLIGKQIKVILDEEIGLVCSAYPLYSLSTPCSITPRPGFLNYYHPTIRKWFRLWTDSSEEGKGTRQENESINVTLIKKLILTLLLYLNK
jgi:hypothetical protein